MKVLRFLDEHLERCVMTLLMSALVVVIMLQIVRRYLFDSSLFWSEEFCRYCYIWLMFMSFSYSARLGTDLRVEVLVNLLPPKGKLALELLRHLVCLAFTAFLFVCTLTTVKMAAQTGERGVALSLPMSYVYAASVAGYGLGMVRYLQQLAAFMRRLRRPAPEQGGGL